MSVVLVIASLLSPGTPHAAVAAIAAPAARPQPAGAQTNSAPPVLIRVGLAREAQSLELGASGAYELLDLASGTVLFRGQGDRSAALRPSGDGLAVNGARLQAVGVRLRASPGAYASLDGRRYRGELEVRPRGGRLQAINVLDVEDYLLGVVPREMPASWPAQALKAQAVAARTYALYQIREGKFRAEGFDVVDTVESQVYGGLAAEDPRSSQAVRDTRGEAALFGGQPIAAYFHSSSGGHTEHSEIVWGKVLPYIRGVPDFDQASPRYRWERRFTPDELSAAFAAAGHPVGRILRLEPDGQPGVSGRWTGARVVGEESSVTLPATEVRKLLGLDSTLFEVVASAGGVEERAVALDPSRPAVAVGGGGARRTASAGELWVLGANGRAVPVTAVSQSPLALTLTAVPAGFELRGRGYGHGTGLSQWGARALAERGESYQKIVGYYYQGIALGPGGSTVAQR